ncbi:hypothetical protein ACFQY0_04080 [Haloferula chungangensis]|uniref:DUF2314 domain-containing protein n=1 Tax=Haloferula chungangensis TaxID=1048331 RepID=A0ABW2L5C1_9BACT
MDRTYPYARPEPDGYHLELVEFDKWVEHSHLRHPVPADEHRFGIKKGELVKLIFSYEKPNLLNEQVYRAEHMWVEYLGNGKGCMMGRLDSDPEHTALLQADDLVAFHPKHIIQIWGYDPDEGVKRGTTALPPKIGENKPDQDDAYQRPC